MPTDEQLGEQLLTLYRQRCQYEYPTLNGHKPSDFYPRHLLTEQIEILSQTIGGRNKTKIRKECKERGIPPPDFKNEV